MADRSTLPEEPHGQPHAPKPQLNNDGSQRAILPVLQNWQVLDAATSAEFACDVDAIDGSATVVGTQSHDAPVVDGLPSASSTTIDDRVTDYRATDSVAIDDTAEGHTSQPQIADQLDPAIIVTLAQRSQMVLPGEAVDYTLTILNNGALPATYQIQVEGWIAETWIPRSPPTITLKPGEKRTITITIAPPRTPQSSAGDRAVAFVVRDSSDNTHVTRLGATLTILPYTELRLGPPQPETVRLTWWQQRATVSVPLTNRSNYPVSVRLQARQAEPVCAYSITLPPQATGRSATSADTTRSQEQTSAATQGNRTGVVQLPPGTTAPATVALQAKEHPLIALKQRASKLQFVATAVEQPDLPFQPWTRSTALSLTAAPWIGPWQLTSLIGLMAIMLTGIGLIGMGGLILFSLTMRQPEVVTTAPPPVAVAQQPVIVAYIQAPVPQNREGQVPANQGQIPATQENVGQPAVSGAPIVVVPPASQPDLAAIAAAPAAPAGEAPPILSAEQVSSPQVHRIQSNAAVALPMVEISAPATPAPMTYATMFYEIGARYDLSWRILAAQAYVESSFDSLALGTQGDLGLMQVHPATWREWAPTLNVADPFDSYSNALVAAAYLDYLRSILQKRGHSELEWALVAYNWGIDKVLQHLDSGQGWQELSPNRQAYAIEILRLAETIPDNR